MRTSLDTVLRMKNKGDVIIKMTNMEAIKDETFLFVIFLQILEYNG